MYLRHSSNVIVDLWYMILNHFGVNHFISVFIYWLWTDRPTDRPTDRRSDIASYRDALDASKNVRMYLRHSSNVIVDLWYCFHYLVTDGRTAGRTDGPTDGQTEPLIEMRGRI